jgi:hypothetical protein
MSDAAKRTLRTVVQTLVGLCLLLPSAVGSAGLTGTLPWAAGAVAVAGALSRVMAVPAVQALLPSWLRTEVPVNGDAALRALGGAGNAQESRRAPEAGDSSGGPEASASGSGSGSGSRSASDSGFGFTGSAARPAPGPGTGGEGGGA